MPMLLGIACGFIAVLSLLWLWRLYLDIGALRAQTEHAWQDLAAAITQRREMIPFFVANLRVNASTAIETLGNAVDLAAHVTTIPEVAQAEVRMDTALRALLNLVDQDPTHQADDGLIKIRGSLAEAEARIGFLAGAFNNQAEAFNRKLETSRPEFLACFPRFREFNIFDRRGPAAG